MDTGKTGGLPRKLRDELALENARAVRTSETTVVVLSEDVRNAAAHRADGLVTELRMRMMIGAGYIPSGARGVHGEASLMTAISPDAQKTQLSNMDADTTPPSPGR